MASSIRTTTASRSQQAARITGGRSRRTGVMFAASDAMRSGVLIMARSGRGAFSEGFSAGDRNRNQARASRRLVAATAERAGHDRKRRYRSHVGGGANRGPRQEDHREWPRHWKRGCAAAARRTTVRYSNLLSTADYRQEPFALHLEIIEARHALLRNGTAISSRREGVTGAELLPNQSLPGRARASNVFEVRCGGCSLDDRRDTGVRTVAAAGTGSVCGFLPQWQVSGARCRRSLGIRYIGGGRRLDCSSRRVSVPRYVPVESAIHDRVSAQPERLPLRSRV